jgi:hypothetical protein
VCGSVTSAADRAGISRKSLYKIRADDADFAEKWAGALESFGDVLEHEARRRGVQGVEEPVFQGGQQVGTVRRFSDTLLLAMLRARIPAYRPAAPAAQVAEAGPVERDPIKLARKIAYALAIAKKSEERQGAG